MYIIIVMVQVSILLSLYGLGKKVSNMIKIN